MFYSINQNKKITPKSWILALISLYGVWELGVMFFSGTSLSLYEKTHININATYTAIFIAAGYITTIFLNYFFYKKSILFGKIALIFSLIITIMMFIPVSTIYFMILFYANVFSCTFLIGINYAVQANLLDNKSELKFVFISSFITFTSIGLLQGDFLHIPFFVFNIVSTAILSALTVVYFLLPKNVDTYNKADAKNGTKVIKVPISLKIGIYFAIFISILCLLFGTTIAESVKYGVGIFYTVGIIFTLLFSFLVYKKKMSPYKIYIFSFIPSVIGFIFAILSIQFTWCVYPAIILIGASCLPANMTGFLSNTLFELKPSNIYVPTSVSISLIVASLQVGLLELFRNNLSVLFSVISVLAIVMIIVYSSIELILSHSWKKSSIIETLEPDDFEVSDPKDDLFDILTKQEKEIANYILQGYNNAEIAKILMLSPQAIKHCRKTIYLSLNINSRSELLFLVKRNKTKK